MEFFKSVFVKVWIFLLVFDFTKNHNIYYFYSQFQWKTDKNIENFYAIVYLNNNYIFLNSSENSSNKHYTINKWFFAQHRSWLFEKIVYFYYFSLGKIHEQSKSACGVLNRFDSSEVDVFERNVAYSEWRRWWWWLWCGAYNWCFWRPSCSSLEMMRLYTWSTVPTSSMLAVYMCINIS